MDGELSERIGPPDGPLAAPDVAPDGTPDGPDSPPNEPVGMTASTASALTASAIAETPAAEAGDLTVNASHQGADQPTDHALVRAPASLPTKAATRGVTKPLPLTPSAVLLLVGAGLAVVAAAAGLALALTEGDWGSAARAAGLATLALGAICLGVGLVRSLRGGGRLARLGIAAVVLCALLGGGALAAANPLRLAQGHLLEAHHDWPGALRAYLLAGEASTASSDPARVYLEWGDTLAAQAQYAGAIDRYEQAIVRYPQAQRQLRRAIASLWPTYAAWISIPSGAVPYPAIVQTLHGYQRSDWCTSDCQRTALALEAQASFAYGLELASEQQYAQAIHWLENVRTADPTSPYVPRAHATAATAYYALGLAQLHGPNCGTAALPAFQTLASAYKDTPEGQRAGAALAAPVQVSGHLTGYPNSPAPTMYLSTKVYSASHFSDNYSATLDGAGNFSFAQVALGAYNLSAAFGDGSGRYWQSAQGNNPYAVVVAPLCALNLGTYSW